MGSSSVGFLVIVRKQCARKEIRVKRAYITHALRMVGACVRVRVRAQRAHERAPRMGRYVLTLCNGRIKDGPTPVKAPHTRRRLTTLFLRPTLARTAARSRSPVSPSRPISLSLSLSRRCTSFSHDSCLSPSRSIFISLRTLPLSSSRRLAPRQSDRSLARSLALLIRKHALSLSLSHSSPSPSRHAFPSLSLFLVLPYPPPLAPRYSTIPRPPVPLSVLLSFFDQFFDPIQTEPRAYARVYAWWNVWGLELRSRILHACTYTRSDDGASFFFFFLFLSSVHRTSHPRRAPGFLLFLHPFSLPSFLSLALARWFEIRTSKLRSIILQERSGAQWRRQREEVEELLAGTRGRDGCRAIACDSSRFEMYRSNVSNFCYVRGWE